jgi:hypothetical protein
MNIKQLQYSLFPLLLLFFFSIAAVSQTQQWSLITDDVKSISQDRLMVRKEMPTTYQIYNLKESAFRSKISTTKKTKQKTIQIPTLKGLKTFYIEESSNFSKELAAKYVNVKTYSGKQVDNNAIKMKFSKGLDGYHFAIYEPGKPSFYVDSYTKDNKKLIAYSKNNLQKKASNFTCEVLDLGVVKTVVSFENKITNDGLLRTFRLAVATTGEYSQFQLDRLGISTSAAIAVKKEAVLSAINATITRISGVFENDLGVKFELVANNDGIIFLDAEDDGLSNNDPNSLISESQTKIDAVIGNANYDVGHTFSTGAGGLAGLGVVCTTNQKGRGVTGIGAPFGDEFDIDFVAHEFGHQFGANHTFNGTVGSCSGSNRNNNTAVEPGSGSTIMGYAGICSSQNIQNDSHDNFHSVSIAEMINIISSSATCATTSTTGNTAPTANAGLDYSIPKSTPFILKGSATDVDAADVLTYNWEQIDNEVGFTIPPVSANGGGAMFRSLPSSLVSSRFMPTLNTVLSGATSSTWEALPSVARELDFSLTVRDNNSLAGSTARDDVRITVVDAIAFKVTSQSTTTIWNAGSTQNITWSTGTSDVAPINCKNITIKLSEDGGLTFPIILISNTANDGSENVIVPNNVTTQARIMIEAVDNIFYNVNDVNFEIESTLPSFVLKNNSGDLSACNSGEQTVNYTLNLDFINGFTENVSFAASGQPDGSAVAFSPTAINSDGNVVMSVSSLNGATAKDYTINIQGNSSSVNQDIAVKLSVTDANISRVVLTFPANGAAEVSLVEMLSWQGDTNASSYIVEVASDENFSTIVTSGTPTSNAYTLTNLDGDTVYYWRVKPKNSCNEGSFSDIFSFTTEIPRYCASTFTDEAGGTEHITNVTFNTINNNSGNDLIDGYQDFTEINTTVLKEVNYTVSVTFDTGGFQDHCYVFIDWNQDFIFDKETERYDLGSKLDDISIATFSIKVPLEARFGQTTMRVVIEYDDPDNGFGDGACDADHLTEWGETEDYTILVTEPVLDPNNIFVQIVSETCVDEKDGVIIVNVKQNALDYTATITNATTNLTSNITGFSQEFNGLSPGMYEVCVETVQLGYTQCFEVEIVASQPISLKATASKNSNKYSFNIDKGTAPFSLFLNDKLIRRTHEKSFEIILNQGGKLEVKTAKDCEGVFKTTINTVLLLQNPVVNSIALLIPLGTEDKTLEAIIFDINGRLVFKKLIKIQDNLISIPFQNFAKGVYILKLSIDPEPIKILKQ